MEEKDLIEKIKWLNAPAPNGGNIKLSLLADVEDVFINLPENKELKHSFKLSKYHDNGWEWHQLVRIVLERPETKQYMYDRLLSLVLKHRRSHEDYFEIKNEEGIFRIPNPLADLNKLELLYNRYYVIYKRIVDQIHFDNPRIEHYGPSIIGKINWTRTLTRSSQEFPLAFSTSIQKKDFDTPENILLVLCAEWMHRESNRLLHIRFDEPLTEYKKDLLRRILKQTKSILQQFPIVSVLNSSKKYWNLSYNDVRIKKLEYETSIRLNQELIHNTGYSLLLMWIEEFRHLDLAIISEKTPTKHIIEPIMNVDTIYEIWIFMEFIEFLYEKYLLIDFRLGANPHCKFEYNGNVITFWYEREFAAEGPNAWIQKHKPDFTAMMDEQIIAVFDAKNYSKSSSVSDTINKMLAYMTNLDANFGALLYPNHPKNWEDLNKSERIEKLIRFMSTQNPVTADEDVMKIIKRLSDHPWKQLPKEYQAISPPIHIKKYQYPRQGKEARYHHDQTLCLFRMSPINSGQAISMKKDTLNSIFDEIVKRIPLKTKVSYVKTHG
jgi:hypothetical protein